MDHAYGRPREQRIEAIEIGFRADRRERAPIDLCPVAKVLAHAPCSSKPSARPTSGTICSPTATASPEAATLSGTPRGSPQRRSQADQCSQRAPAPRTAARALAAARTSIRALAQAPRPAQALSPSQPEPGSVTRPSSCSALARRSTAAGSRSTKLRLFVAAMRIGPAHARASAASALTTSESRRPSGGRAVRAKRPSRCSHLPGGTAIDAGSSSVGASLAPSRAAIDRAPSGSSATRQPPSSLRARNARAAMRASSAACRPGTTASVGMPRRSRRGEIAVAAAQARRPRRARDRARPRADRSRRASGDGVRPADSRARCGCARASSREAVRRPRAP